MADRDRQARIEINLRFFRTLLPSLINEHRGRYALLRDETLVGVYDTVRDAKLTADRFFEDGNYSIQQITETPVNLGFYSHAGFVSPA